MGEKTQHTQSVKGFDKYADAWNFHTPEPAEIILIFANKPKNQGKSASSAICGSNHMNRGIYYYILFIIIITYSFFNLPGIFVSFLTTKNILDLVIIIIIIIIIIINIATVIITCHQYVNSLIGEYLWSRVKPQNIWHHNFVTFIWKYSNARDHLD